MTNIQYQSSLVIDFATRYEGDYVLEDPDAKYDPKKNDKIGHVVRGFIRKCDTEKYDAKFEYCVKYGRKDGNSVWVEREIIDQMLAWHLLTRESAKSSLCLDAELYKELQNIDKDIPDSFRSINKIQEYLESQQEVTKQLTERIKKLLY